VRADQRNFVPLDSNVPLRGLATSPPTTRLNPSLSPRLKNVTVRDGIIRRRAGYLQLGVRLVGRVLGLIEFGPLGGIPILVALTSQRQYAYDTNIDEWVDITEGQLSDTITGVNQGTKTFTVAAVRPFFAPGFLFSVDSGANAGAYTVVSTTATDIVVAEAIPSATVAGNIISIDPASTEAFDTPAENSIRFVDITDVDLTSGTTRRRLLITNGEDFPRTWDGLLASTFIRWDVDFPEFQTCNTVAVFRDHLFVGGLQLAGLQELQSIAWSNAGNFDDFVSGSTGIQLLHEAELELVHMEPLGDRLAIYSFDTIHLATFLGGDAVFAFEATIPTGTRLASAGSIISIDLGHVFVAEENFYIFDGSRGLLVIGEAIYNDYAGNKDQENLHRLTALNDYSKRTLFFSVPQLDGTSTIYTGVYDLTRITEISWAKDVYADVPTTFGFFTNRHNYTWDDAPWEPANTTWGDELGQWGEEGEQVLFPVRVFGSAVGDVFLVTEGVFKDNLVAVEESYETMDFTLPSYLSQLGRCVELDFEASGTKVNVSVSVDRGASFTLLKADFVLEPEPRFYQQDLDIVGRTVRFKFDSLEDFSLFQIRAWVNPGGPR